MKIIVSSTLLLFLVPATIVAETIYKTIDQNGKATYSNSPAKHAEKSTSVNITPPPSEEAIKAAHDRHQRNKDMANILQKNKEKRDEIAAEENRLKREQQRQLQQQRQAERNNENDNYNAPYIPGRRPGGILPPAHRPVQLPTRPH